MVLKFLQKNLVKKAHLILNVVNRVNKRKSLRLLKIVFIYANAYIKMLGKNYNLVIKMKYHITNNSRDFQSKT